MVIGVMPRDFEFPLVPGRVNNSALWVPVSLDPGGALDREFSVGASIWSAD